LSKPRRLRRFSISDARFALFNIKWDIAHEASTEIGYLFYLKNGGTLEKAAQMANHVHARDAALRPAGGGSDARRGRKGVDLKRRAPGIGSAKQFSGRSWFPLSRRYEPKSGSWSLTRG
jgi:hypothetical protein